MIDIRLNNGQSGYDVIAEYIRRYWEHHGVNTVVISIGVSYDGNDYYFLKDVASPTNCDDVEFMYDWWEGERYIKLIGIRGIDELTIIGGVYTDDESK